MVDTQVGEAAEPGGEDEQYGESDGNALGDGEVFHGGTPGTGLREVCL
jgi:hypothetical protein